MMKNIIISITCFILAIECVLAQDHFAKNIVASIPYNQKQVVLRMIANDTLVTCLNRFNGLGIGLYASSNGKKSSQKALFLDFK